ncbi:respiratory nitrate reductase subunit gamma [Bacillus kwashiorkori]|uniref:respiratory nitrate reductase subunit gamma n=1 Tax=Bacillus kwashiorkori TaxID=1522318 RepID=UPI0009812CE9|nr:respiratory nitrate reductase subunit gamma [Bacillus kwashiorkori]
MTMWDQFFWLIFPYLMLTIFVVGHVWRYNTDQFGWSAKSSEFLEKRYLRWGSTLFHWGIVFVFFGHVAGVLVPRQFFDMLGITDEMYHFGAVWFGGAAGVATIVGLFLLMWRRFSVKRILRNSTKADILVLILLTIVTLTGFTNTVAYTATGGHFDYRSTIGPWFRGILTFRPDIMLVVQSPFGFQLHIISAFLLFGIFPFTRLVHMWSLPLAYLRRKYLVYRAVNPKKALQLAKRSD